MGAHIVTQLKDYVMMWDCCSAGVIIGRGWHMVRKLLCHVWPGGGTLAMSEVHYILMRVLYEYN